MLKTRQYGPVTRLELARTLFGRGRYWTTAYLVDGMLIDSGCAFTASELVAELADLPLVRIANTHTHEDHIGANGPLQRQRNGLEIFVHPLGLPVLTDPHRFQPLHPYRRVYWGWPEPSFGRPIGDGDIVETEHYTFQAIHTPGHSRDHLCYYEAREGWLFTGDLYVGGQDRALRQDYEIWQIIASLKRIAALPATRLFPGSARVRDDPAEALAAKINHLEEMGERVLALSRQGVGAGEVARRVCGPPMMVELITLGHFSRRALVESYLRIPRDSGRNR